MYYSDEPIESSCEDKLDRKGFCKTFAKSIYDLKQIDTFTVGLLGKWGSGKTSFLLDMKKAMMGKCYLIDFKPWHCQTPDSLQ